MEIPSAVPIRYDAGGALTYLGFKANEEILGQFSSEKPVALLVNARGGKVTEFESSRPDARHRIKDFEGEVVNATGADISGDDITIYAGDNLRYTFKLSEVSDITKSGQENK